MNFFTTLSQYSFMQNALIVGLLSSISCGIIGTYIVNKKMVFISSSISHASFGGIGIGIYIISIYLFLNIVILFTNKRSPVKMMKERGK